MIIIVIIIMIMIIIITIMIIIIIIILTNVLGASRQSVKSYFKKLIYNIYANKSYNS